MEMVVCAVCERAYAIVHKRTALQQRLRHHALRAHSPRRFQNLKTTISILSNFFTGCTRHSLWAYCPSLPPR
jgi:hypothetical protein